MSKSKSGLDIQKIRKVKEQITKHIKEHSSLTIEYGQWYCGITKFNGDKRKKEHMKLKHIPAAHFKMWDAETFENAHAVEVYFSSMNMQNAPHAGGATFESRFVYVYKNNIGTEFLDFIDKLFGD